MSSAARLGLFGLMEFAGSENEWLLPRLSLNVQVRAMQMTRTSRESLNQFEDERCAARLGAKRDNSVTPRRASTTENRFHSLSLAFTRSHSLPLASTLAPPLTRSAATQIHHSTVR